MLLEKIDYKNPLVFPLTNGPYRVMVWETGQSRSDWNDFLMTRPPRLKGAVVYCLRLFNFAIRPTSYLLRRSNTDFNCVKRCVTHYSSSSSSASSKKLSPRTYGLLENEE